MSHGRIELPPGPCQGPILTDRLVGLTFSFNLQNYYKIIYNINEQNNDKPLTTSAPTNSTPDNSTQPNVTPEDLSVPDEATNQTSNE